jgi:hypothetical protein
VITKIPYQECLRRFPNMPWSDPAHDTFFFPKEIKHRILLLHSKSAKGHAKLLSSEMMALLRPFHATPFIFCLDVACPWLRFASDYLPVQQALAYLKHNKVPKTFDGALMADEAAQPLFFSHLFWLVRCHAALPIIYFMDVEQRFWGTICQYGNLHISTLSDAAENDLQGALSNSKFVETDTKGCHSTFTKSSKIAHRQIVV